MEGTGPSRTRQGVTQSVKINSMLSIKNKLVAERIGMSESGVWFIRNGHRFPTVETMEKIEEAYGWEVNDQFSHRDDYPNAFESILQEFYEENGLSE